MIHYFVVGFQLVGVPSDILIHQTRVFPRPFTHGGDLSPHMGGTSAGDKALMGGTHEGGHRPYGGGG